MEKPMNGLGFVSARTPSRRPQCASEPAPRHAAASPSLLFHRRSLSLLFSSASATAWGSEHGAGRSTPAGARGCSQLHPALASSTAAAGTSASDGRGTSVGATGLPPTILARIMDPKEKPEATSSPPPPPRLDCIKCFDMLWFCYSPFHQMQNYYRFGEFDNCFGKWGDLVDCLTLKTKRAAEVEEILIAREKAKPHIWTYRTVDEASENWWRMYKHFVVMSPPLSGSAQLRPKSDNS